MLASQPYCWPLPLSAKDTLIQTFKKTGKESESEHGVVYCNRVLPDPMPWSPVGQSGGWTLRGPNLLPARQKIASKITVIQKKLESIYTLVCRDGREQEARRPPKIVVYNIS